MRNELTFVAYYYPGWHRESWKALDEWVLLDEVRPIYPGHLPLDEPTAGRYDDTDPIVLRQQITEATKSGISAFSFFLYYGPDGYVLDRPTRIALYQAEEIPDLFSIGVTWCMRLPHQYFPIPTSDDNAPLASAEPREAPAPTSKRLAEVVPRDLRNVPVRTVSALTQGRSTKRRSGPAKLSVVLTANERKEVLTEPLEKADPSVAQVVAFMADIRAEGPSELGELLLDDLEAHLALTGLLDIPLGTVIQLLALARETETVDGDDDYAQAILLDSFARVFEPAPAYVEPRDVGAVAHLARKVAGVDVFSGLALADVMRVLSIPALNAFSLRDLRTAIESIASAESLTEGP